VPDLPNGTITVSTTASLPTAVMPLIGVSMLQITATTTVKLE
jgi:hypothetical protein